MFLRRIKKEEKSNLEEKLVPEIISVGKARLAHKANNLTATYKLIV
jgi:hypothetical protein